METHRTVLDENFFFDITRELFNHRRKKIKNTLEMLEFDVELENVPHLDDRVEMLSPEQIGAISNLLYRMQKK